MELLMMSIAQLLLGFFFAGICVLLWCLKHSWFAENRQLTDMFPRYSTSWNTDHEFFDKITEYRNDFVS